MTKEYRDFGKVSPKKLQDKYPLESSLKVPRSNGTVSEGVVLEYLPEENLVLVGFGAGDRGLDFKHVAAEDLARLNPEGPWLSNSDKPIARSFEVGSEVFIRRRSGAVEKGVVLEVTPNGKYIKVASRSKTWKWFPCDVLTELQKNS